MTQDEIKHWIDRWSKLPPSPRRDMTIKIWSKLIKTNNVVKRCTGCGRLDNEPLGLNQNGEPYLACCPDSNYKEITGQRSPDISPNT